MFDAYEAVDELIDDINTDYYESCYDAIYEELCNRVAYGELTIEEAEMINEAAAEKYLYEAKNVDKALETDDDDDKKKKKSDKNIKKKINKKKVAAGVGLAAGAGALAYGVKKYNDSATDSFLKFEDEKFNREANNPRKIRKYIGPEYVKDVNYRNFRKAVKNQKDIYKKANKLGKKKILDKLKYDRNYKITLQKKNDM